MCLLNSTGFSANQEKWSLCFAEVTRFFPSIYCAKEFKTAFSIQKQEGCRKSSKLAFPQTPFQI